MIGDWSKPSFFVAVVGRKMPVSYRRLPDFRALCSLTLPLELLEGNRGRQFGLFPLKVKGEGVKEAKEVFGRGGEFERICMGSQRKVVGCFD